MRSRMLALTTVVLAGLIASPAHAGRCGDQACRADLSMYGHAEPQPIRIGEHSEYKFTVQDNGPDGALAVKLHATLTPGLKILNAVVYGGQGCSVDGTFVSCDIGDLVKLQQAVVRIRVEGVKAGTYLARAEVFGYDIDDPNGGNNQVTATVGVMPKDGNSGTSGVGGTSSGGATGGGLSLRATDPQRILKTGGVTIRAVIPRAGTLRLRGSVKTTLGSVALVSVTRGVRAGETVDIFLGTTAKARGRLRTALAHRSRLPVTVQVTLGSLRAKLQLHVRR